MPCDCMKCHFLFVKGGGGAGGEKNITNLSSAELAQSVVKVNMN